MASAHAARQWLEVFKFSVYVVTPICATVYLGSGAYPYLESIIANREYVKYPAEDERATPELIEATANELKRRRLAAAASAQSDELPEQK